MGPHAYTLSLYRLAGIACIAKPGTMARALT